MRTGYGGLNGATWPTRIGAALCLPCPRSVVSELVGRKCRFVIGKEDELGRCMNDVVYTARSVGFVCGGLDQERDRTSSERERMSYGQ